MTEEELSKQYNGVRTQYEMAANHIKDLISTQISKYKVQDIQCRAKKTNSFVNKSFKLNSDGSPKYTDPFKDITDLAGVRIICFLKRDVDHICELINNMFGSDGIEDVGERIFQKGRFGYQSKHILVKLPKATYLPNFDLVDEIVCEVQVRTLLQHAWAEMEHDIQYKGESVPDSLRKKFVALAGLLEIADGEFERIQMDSDALKSAVEEELLSRLTAEGFQEIDSSTASKNNQQSIRGVRDLVASGHYEDALNLYNNKIQDQPNAYTLYIGRAKVKFILGDSFGAISDLDIAQNINKSDAAIDNLRKLIIEGDVESVNTNSYQIDNTDKIESMFQLMLEGKGREAFDVITDLEEDGYNKAFAFFNKASCCLLELDVLGAKEYLSKLKTHVGSPMSVNIHILKYFISVIDEFGQKESMNELKLIISAAPHFKLELSPILNFFSGFKIRHRAIFNKVQKEFNSIDQVRFPK